MRSVFLYLLFAAGNSSYYLLPLLSDALKRSQLDSQTIGLILAAELFFKTLTIFFASRWLSYLLQRRKLLLLLLLLLLFNCSSWILYVFEFGESNSKAYGLIVLRSLVGLINGLLSLVVYRCFSLSPKPARHYSLSLAWLIAIGVLSLLVFAFVPANVPNVFIAISVVALFPVLLLPLVNIRGDGVQDTKAPQAKASLFGSASLLGLSSIGIFFCAMNLIWVALLNLGQQAGVKAANVSALLSLALVFSFLGAILAARQSRRESSLRFRLLQWPQLLIIACLLLYLGLTRDWVFVLMVIAFDLLYAFVIPFQGASLVYFDRSGKASLLIPVVQGCGLTLGAFLSAWFVEVGGTYSVVLASLVLLALSCLLWWFLQNHYRRMTSAAQGQEQAVDSYQ